MVVRQIARLVTLFFGVVARRSVFVGVITVVRMNCID